MAEVVDKSSEELQREITELKEMVATLDGNWKRVLADYRNLEKRVEAEKDRWFQLANLPLLSRLLTVLEDLERAQNHLHDSGLEIVYKDLKNILTDQGLREIQVAVGGSFDPKFHECVEVVSGPQDQKVVALVAQGYIIGERVVRPVKVKVSKKEPEAVSPEEAERGLGR